MTRISVAIPAYNAEQYLREALDSVFAQTLKPHEIILVNDGSSDRTEEIALSYGDSIRYIKQDNQGLAGARNTAIRAATGDWIAFFDADDVMLAEKIERQTKAIEANPAVVVVYSGFTFLFPDGSTSNSSAFPARELWPALRYRSPILPSTSIVRRDALLEMDGFRTVPTEDWDLWFRLIRRWGPAGFQDVPESLLLYRQLDTSLSKKYMNMTRGRIEMLDNLLLDGLSGVSREMWKRKLEAKIFYQVSLAMRENNDQRYWAFAIESLLRWPLWGKVNTPFRYVVFANMFYRKLRNFQFSRQYWWPTRQCRTELSDPVS